MLIAYKYRIYPSTEQKVSLAKHFGCARWVYNYGLDLKIRTYNETGQPIHRFEIQSKLPLLKRKEETSWLKEVCASSMQAELLNLQTAYDNFFKHKRGFPCFKSKTNRKSYAYPKGVKIKDEIIYLPKIGWVKYVNSRQFTGKIKTCTVSKTTTNKYFVSILVECEKQIPELKPIDYNITIGIDTGIKTFVTCSNGQTFENAKYLKNSLGRLKVLQRRASRKKKGSNNRKKANLRVARLHEYITNQRLDLIHKVTHELTTGENQASVICVEDLNVAGMVKNHNLAQALSDVSLGKFYEILTYKCKWNGINLVKVNRFYPSSKTCNSCGAINQNLLLSDRSWICECGTDNDRDNNASLNIRDEGYKIITTGRGSSGEPVESLTVVKAEKQEKV